MEYYNEYLQIELDVQKRILDSELKNYFDIRFNVRWRNAYEFREFDIVLYQNDTIYAIIEIKANLNHKLYEIARKQVSTAIDITKCRFGIITDNKTYYLFDTKRSNFGFEKQDFEQIVQHLINPETFSPSNDGITRISDVIKSYIVNNDLVANIIQDIRYDERQGNYSFSKVESEQNFFLSIVGGVDPKNKVYRYVSLDTLFNMLNTGKYRMSGIVGMNDKSEKNYFDDNCPIGTSGSSVRELNDTYLSSCCALEDDLTMWRLYGDDGKGVCLEFEVLPPEKRLGNFILANVSYAEERDKGKHKILNMLTELNKSNLRFSELYKWKHFFKPYEYKVEEEIRLMFFDNGRYDNGVADRNWVKTWSHSIINPIVEFKLNAPGFPLQLKRIILGPKFPEREDNKSQMDYLLYMKKYSIEIDISQIENYR